MKYLGRVLYQYILKEALNNAKILFVYVFMFERYYSVSFSRLCFNCWQESKVNTKKSENRRGHFPGLFCGGQSQKVKPRVGKTASHGYLLAHKEGGLQLRLWLKGSLSTWWVLPWLPIINLHASSTNRVNLSTFLQGFQNDNSLQLKKHCINVDSYIYCLNFISSKYPLITWQLWAWILTLFKLYGLLWKNISSGKLW